MGKTMLTRAQRKPKRLISMSNPPRPPKLSPRWVERELARAREIGLNGRRVIVYGLATLPRAEARGAAQKGAVSHIKSRFGKDFVLRKNFAVGKIFREWETAMRKISARGYRSLSPGEMDLVIAIVKACREVQSRRR